ncbi:MULTISPECIES: flavodoxin family protein [Eubacteriales]|uniref:flavodoxin family protein n=1 Tax=Eubacteriales TaxID=186802 RepID=UPI00028B25FE|nr:MULTISPECIES: flavodoxin family protein [Eubacteriales]AFV04071.1 NADPH-dependent FMN reductase [Dehalobacter sp. CF]EQB22444.1 NADPH-dependent FMN reductase [Dehalobacter sp. UNSWDHB]MDJ0304425.1 flavodoxin family protein [Dehalobacter sp.]
MILGISGSPRENGITAHAIKEILSQSKEDTQYISLFGKHIGGCISCLGCTKDNKCVVEDDFQEIAEAMAQADAIVLGVPNYYDVPNALTHAMLERCFCFRHQGTFSLKDKPIVILSTGYSKDEENSQVLNIVEHFANKNKMKVISKFLVGAFSQCYSCKYGMTCADGNIVKDNGFVDKITTEMLPPKFKQQENSILKCHRAADTITKLLAMYKERKGVQ